METTHQQSSNITKLFGNGNSVQIDSLALKVSSALGSGGFGDVFGAYDRLNGRRYAIKCLHWDGFDDISELKQVEDMFNTEFDLHSSVKSHDNIVNLHCKDQNGAGDTFYMVTDLCEGGDLDNTIYNTSYFWKHDDRIRETMRQIIDAVGYCHSQGISHRDIKPDNILMSREDQSGERTCFLADFGLAHRGPQPPDQYDVGTNNYKAPGMFAFRLSVRRFSSDRRFRTR